MKEEFKKFEKNNLVKLLETVGSKLSKEIILFMVGGGSMVLKGIKLDTKDIDLVIMTKKEFNVLKNTLIDMKYKFYDALEETDFYRKPLIVFRKGKVRIDIFIKDIAGQLEFNKFMQKKSIFYKKFDKLIVKLASNEDIFLAKCLTDREKDIDDCMGLINNSLNDKRILKELSMQEKKILWRFWIYEQLCRIENKYKITIPIKKNILKLVKEKWNERPKDFMKGIKDKNFGK